QGRCGVRGGGGGRRRWRLGRRAGGRRLPARAAVFPLTAVGRRTSHYSRLLAGGCRQGVLACFVRVTDGLFRTHDEPRLCSRAGLKRSLGGGQAAARARAVAAPSRRTRIRSVATSVAIR